MVQTETIRREFSQRLIEALSDANYPAHGRGIKLARELGVSSKAVSKWLSGEALPRPAKMKDLAKLLNVDHLWLQHGEDTRQGERRILNALFRHGYPLVEWDHIHNLDDLVDENFKQFKMFCSGSVIEQGKAFWLLVKDDTMTSPTGLCVPEKSMILVDSNRLPASGNLVIAQIKDAKEATFKQLIVDHGTNKRYLRPLNRNYKPIEIDETCHFFGVVVESRLSLVSPDLADVTYPAP